MEKVRSMRAFFIKSSERVFLGYAVFGTTWAGTALTNFRLLPFADCPVDSRATVEHFRCPCANNHNLFQLF